MSEVPDHELFSAYLDGELTAEEQVRAEQILAVSPAARQLLEELRALGGTLQSLPQQHLDEDVTARVLEIAERRMLLPGDLLPGDGDKPLAGRAAASLSSDADSCGWLGIPWREISWRGMVSKRALAWSAVVIGTALVIHFKSPPPPQAPREVARTESVQGPPTPPASEKAPLKRAQSEIAWESADRKEQRRDNLDLAEMRKAPNERASNDKAPNDKIAGDTAGSIAAKGAGGMEKQRQFKDTDRKISAAEAGKTAAGKDQLSRDDGAKAKTMKDLGKHDEKRPAPPIDAVAQMKSAPSAVQGSAAAQPGEVPPPAAAPAPAKPGAPAAPAEPVRAAGNAMQADAATNGPLPTSPPPTSQLPASQPSAMGESAGALPELASNTASRAGAAQSWSNSARNSAAGGSLGFAGKSARGEPQSKQAGNLGEQRVASRIIVRLDVSRQAVESKVFEKLLARAGLGIEPSTTSNGSLAFKAAENVQTQAAPAKAQAAPASAQYSTPSNAPLEKRGAHRDYEAGPQQTLQQIVLVCDASQEQLAAVVEQVRKNSESFSLPDLSAEGLARPDGQPLAQNGAYGTVDRGGLGGGEGEKPADRPVEQERSKGEADQTNRLREQAAAQSPAAHAPVAMGRRQAVAHGAARQRVVFVLSVMDRIPPAAFPAAPAAPAAKP